MIPWETRLHPLCVGISSVWGSVDGNRIFSPILWDSSFNWGLWEIQMNEWMALETEHLNSYGPCWQNMERGSFTRDFERKVRFCFIRRPWFFFGGGELQAICKRRPQQEAPLSIADPLGDLKGRFVYQGLWQTVKEGSGNGVSLSMAALWGKPRGRAFLLGGSEGYIKEGSGDRYLSP